MPIVYVAFITQDGVIWLQHVASYALLGLFTVFWPTQCENVYSERWQLEFLYLQKYLSKHVTQIFKNVHWAH